MNIDQSIALVTGANRGIGRALVESLLQRGVRRVYAAGRQLEPLESVAAIDRGRVVPLRMDITNRTEVPAASGANAGQERLAVTRVRSSVARSPPCGG